MKNSERISHLKALIRGVFFSTRYCNQHKTKQIVNILHLFPNERIYMSLYKYVQYLQRFDDGPTYIDIEGMYEGDSLPYPEKTKEELDEELDIIYQNSSRSS